MNQLKKIGLKYSIAGLRSAFSSEFNFRLHILSAIAVIITGFVLDVSSLEWCVLFICIGLVFTAETFNTALEQLVNMVQPEWHPIAGKVKDLASAAVLLSCVASVICAGIIFGTKVFQLL